MGCGETLFQLKNLNVEPSHNAFPMPLMSLGCIRAVEAGQGFRGHQVLMLPRPPPPGTWLLLAQCLVHVPEVLSRRHSLLSPMIGPQSTHPWLLSASEGSCFVFLFWVESVNSVSVAVPGSGLQLWRLSKETFNANVVYSLIPPCAQSWLISPLLLSKAWAEL